MLLYRVTAVVLLGSALPSPGVSQESGHTFAFSSSYALETGGPLSTIQHVTVATLELEVAFRIRSNDRWGIEFPVAVIPVALALHNPLGLVYPQNQRWYSVADSPHGTSYGAGVKPLGLRALWFIGPVTIYSGVSGGIVLFDTPTPGANSSRLNYLGEVDLGLRFRLVGRFLATLGYRWNHLSNANRGEVNPGIDSHMLSVGTRLRW